MDSDFANFSAIAGSRVDGGAGILHGVSIITEGEAAGRNSGTMIDRTTLVQIRDAILSFSDGVKVKLSQSKEHDGSAGQIVGAIKNPRIDGNQLRGDLHLLKSSRHFDFIIELSAKMPDQFGLSIVVPKKFESKGGNDYLRCDEISSVDIVEAPAANKALFSQTNNQTMSAIKYKNGKDGEHHAECDCKECMSKHSKKELSAYIADLLGLSSEAGDDAIKAKFTAFVDSATAPAKKPESTPSAPAAPVELSKLPEFTALTAKLESAITQLSAIQETAKSAAAASKAQEISALVAEASREGKVIGLTDVQLSKLSIDDIKEMLSKLPKNQLRLSRASSPTKTGTSVPTFKTPEERTEFCRTEREKGAEELNQVFAQFAK